MKKGLRALLKMAPQQGAILIGSVPAAKRP